jgi:hypothetical protein
VILIIGGKNNNYSSISEAPNSPRTGCPRSSDQKIEDWTSEYCLRVLTYIKTGVVKDYHRKYVYKYNIVHVLERKSKKGKKEGQFKILPDFEV